MTNLTASSTNGPASEMKGHFLSLHATCSKTLDDSFGDAAAKKMAQSYLFVADLQAWTQSLANRPENELFRVAQQEYVTALLSLAQGQYRNAFKGLRLVLEMIVQGIYLSANLVELNEWLRSAKDTHWAVLVGSQQDAGSEESSAVERGPFTKRFCDAFFSDLRDHAPTFGTMARTLYRELSETIHGNVPRHIPIPPTLEFDVATFGIWHKKAESVRLIGLFCLICRYAVGMSEGERTSIEAGTIEQLGHIEPIRILFGGPATS